MPNWKKVIVSGSDALLNSITSSNGAYLRGNVVITGSAAIGTSSLGPFENTLTLGARDAASEGGQIGFNAPGGTYTSASFIDNWQNKARILKGNNTTSTGLIAQWDIHTTQMQLAGYTAASSFPGTATANLAVDSGGNVITVSTTGGSVFPYVGNAVITGSLTVTQPIYVPINGGMYFQGGDDAALYDINVSNHMGIYGVQDSTVGSIKLGSGGGIISGKSGNIGIGTINPTSASFQVNGNVWATSFTGSLFGTASWAQNVTSASFASTASSVNPLIQNVIITGSLIVSSSNGVLTENIAYDTNNTPSIYFPARTATDSTAASAMDWDNRFLYKGGIAVVDWDFQTLTDPTNTLSADWTNRYLYDSATTSSIQWSSRLLTDSVGNPSLDWDVNSNNGKSISFSYNLKIINDNIQEKFSDVASLGFNYEGEAINGTLDVSVVQFDLIYLETDGIWYQTTQATVDCSKLLGICIDVARQIILLEGSITVNDNSLIDSPYVQLIDHGLPIYIRDGSGTQMSTVQPSSAGQYVRTLGHAYYRNITDSQYWTMKFRPANDWYTI